jgi:hypothetical protein
MNPVNQPSHPCDHDCARARERHGKAEDFVWCEQRGTVVRNGTECAHFAAKPIPADVTGDDSSGVQAKQD